MASTTSSSTNVSANNRSVQRACPSGASEQASVTRWASPSPSAGHTVACLFGAGQGGFQAAFHQPLAHAPHCPGADIKRFADLTVAPALAFGDNVGFQQDLCMLAFIRRHFAYLDQLFQLFPFAAVQTDNILLDQLAAPSICMKGNHGS